MLQKYMDRKIPEVLATVLLNIFFAFVIFYTSELGKFLSLHGAPIAISIMWLPSGFAVAGFLLFGNRIWPGVLLGNFIYTFLHLYLDAEVITAPFLTALPVGFIAMAETFAIAYMMRKYASPDYFVTVKDIAIFLSATLFVSMVSAVFAAIPLYFFDKSLLLPHNFLTIWTYFWVEDTLGIYILAPLLVVWSSHRQTNQFLDQFPKFIGMVVAFALMAVLTFSWGDPLAHLFILPTLWAAYVFKMHGATMANFLISMMIVIPTGLNYGAFASHTANPYLTLTTFIVVTVISSLILAALMNERETAWNLIRNRNMDLKDAFQTHMEGFRDIHTESMEKEKISSSLGLLTFGLSKQIQIPLKRINNLTKASIMSLNRIQESMHSQKDKVSPDLFSAFIGHFKIVDNYLHDILKFEKQADKMAHMIQEQASLSSKEKVKIKEIKLNKLLTLCLNQAAKHFISKHPTFNFVGKTEFDPGAEMAIAFPQELAHAFIFFINHSFELMYDKKKKFEEGYDPTLLLKTINSENKIEVIFEDNGSGASQGQVRDYFHSFVKDKTIDTKAYDLSLAHDIIVYVHEGEIKIYSEKGEFFKVMLTLPKKRAQNKVHSYVAR